MSFVKVRIVTLFKTIYKMKKTTYLIQRLWELLAMNNRLDYKFIRVKVESDYKFYPKQKNKI